MVESTFLCWFFNRREEQISIATLSACFGAFWVKRVILKMTYISYKMFSLSIIIKSLYSVKDQFSVLKARIYLDLFCFRKINNACMY